MSEPRQRSGPHTGGIQPPGPPGLPFLGSLLEARRDPLRFVLAAACKHGDIVHFRMGIYTGYLLNHPDFVQHVLQDNHRHYSRQNFTYRMLKPVLGEGLLTSDGDHWRRQRRLIQPIFHRQRMAAFAAGMTAAAEEMLAGWQATAACGRSIDIAAQMMRLTLHILGEALFSTDISHHAGTIAAAFSALNEDVSYRFRTVFVPPLWVPTPRNLAFRRARAELDRVVYTMIAGRRPAAGGHGDRGDLLDMLLSARDAGSGAGMSDRQLRDEVMTLLLAGHETTATALAWIWILLARHPDVAARLRAELDEVLGGRPPAVDDLPALTYMKQVIQESLRLYPPVWIISRTAMEDDEIGGYPIPAGSFLVLSPYIMHRHPGFWPDPAGFDPDRFAPERLQEHHRYAYFPFGGGPHLCIGASLAMLEIQLILATVAQRYRLALVPGQSVEPEPLVTLRPRHGLRMTVHRVSDCQVS